MIIVGIDPGLSGAIAEMDTDIEDIRVWDMPTVKGKTRGRDLDANALVSLVTNPYQPDLIVMEKPVLARPGEGRGSIGKFGYVTGLAEGIFRGRYPGVPFCLVSPQKWKAHFGLLGQGKDASRELAMEKFSNDKELYKRKKDDGRAEAALMALYGFETYREESDGE